MTAALVKVAGARRTWFLVLLLAFPLLMLFSHLDVPEGIEAGCLRKVSIGHSAHFIHICDSYSITSQMENLEVFLSKPNAWRGRPVYIFAATGLASGLSPVAGIVRQAVLNGRLSGDFNQSDFLHRYPAYFALTVVNFLVLAVALILALHLGGRDGSSLALGLAAIVASCDYMHSLFWSQHPSFLNILVPLGAVFFFVEGCRTIASSPRRIFWLGLFQAVGMLDYAFAVIWTPAFMAGMAFWALRSPESRAKSLLSKLAIFVLVGCGPYLLWFLLNRFYLHVSISFEAEAYRQFVWILDAQQAGQLAAALAEKARQFGPYVLQSQGPAGAFAVTALLLLAWMGRKQRGILLDPMVVGGLVAILGMLSFNFLQGYFQPRMIHGLTIALFLLVMRLSQLTGQQKTGTALLFMGMALQLTLAFTSNPITLG